MIDLHTHILHGLDDGAMSLYTSLEMARMALAAGTTDMVAAPHASSAYKYDPEATAERLQELQQAVGESPRIHWGCHLQLSPENVALALREPGRFAINGLTYVLVEFASAVQIQDDERIFKDLKAAGLTPIVVHPERYRLLAHDRRPIRRWVESGIPVQIASRSLIGEAGPERASWCLDALEEGLVHFVASDAYDAILRPPKLDQAWKILEGQFGAGYADLLLKQNPRAVIDGQSLDIGLIPAPRRKSAKWFPFGSR